MHARTALVSTLLLTGCGGAASTQPIYGALCDEAAGEGRGMLFLHARGHGLPMKGDLGPAAAARSAKVLEGLEDRVAQKAACYEEIEDLEQSVSSSLKLLNFGARLVAKADARFTGSENPLHESAVVSDFEAAGLGARAACERADLKGALELLGEGLRKVDAVLMRTFDTCEANGWERARWEQASPDYAVTSPPG